MTELDMFKQFFHGMGVEIDEFDGGDMIHLSVAQAHFLFDKNKVFKGVKADERGYFQPRKEHGMTQEAQIAMFGCTTAEIDKMIVEDIGVDKQYISLAQAGMDLASDAQQLSQAGRHESARQKLNVAKYILQRQVDLDKKAMRG